MILRRFRLILPVDGGRGRQGDEREEEHLALADYAIIVPTIEPLQASISLPPEAEVERLLIPTMPTPPPSRTSSLSVQPLQGECLVRCTTPSALSSPPPYDVSPSPEQPTSQRSCLVLLEAQYEFGESSTARPTRGRGAEAVPEIAPMTMGEVNTRVTKLAKLHEHDTQDLYALLEDAQDSRTRIA
ncbi:hypothetical protein Tco_1218199 [Tanacetum coccineum]